MRWNPLYSLEPSTMLERKRTTARLDPPPSGLSPVTSLAPSASLAEAIGTHWREYLMEGTELGSLMLSTCIVGTLLYSTDSPLNYLELSRGFTSVLVGTAIAVTTFLIIRSPFGRR